MSIAITLTPEVEEAVRKQAEVRGERVEDFLGAFVKERFLIEQVPNRASVEEFERALDAFSEGTEELPVLTDADLTRDALYAGRS